MMKSTVSTILSGKPPKGINKYMLEEVFFSESCITDEERKMFNNPQQERFIDGKYYFNYPALWYNSMSNNKAIGLRKIDLRAESLNISLKVRISRKHSGSGQDPNPVVVPVKTVARANQSTYSVLQDIYRLVNLVIAKNGRKPWSSNPEKTVELVPYFNYTTSQATIDLNRVYETNNDEYHFSFEIYELNKDAEEFFNIKNENLPVYQACTKQADGTTNYTFNDVWNREFLFVHASFVNGTSFNYLGRSSEFYPKPSKMYPFAGSSQQFYFELSYDGRNPVKKRMGVFCIDLAFIYHDRDYQAE
jgi:hypothetical protein